MRNGYRLATVLTLGLGAGSALLGAQLERATFVLTDGERVAGEVVFHTEARTNISPDKNEFTVKVADGTQRPIPFADVVLIDFIGGPPRDEELAALPARGHLITLRNGTSRRGHLIDMIEGKSVRWSEGGPEVTIPIAETRRIYLQPDRIRNTHDVAGAVARVASGTPQPDGAAPAGVGRVGGRGRAMAEVTVRGGIPWTDTGVAVQRNQRLAFQATGQVYILRDAASGATPAGIVNDNPNVPVKDLRVGGLIAKVGESGTPFALGTNTGAVIMPASGRLMLGINDTQFEDNSGAFVVQIYR
jgi:hypothetical protein